MDTTSGMAGRKTTAHICAAAIGRRDCTICSSPRTSGGGGSARRFSPPLGCGPKAEGYATWSGKRVKQQSPSTSAWGTPVIPAHSPSILSSRSSSPATIDTHPSGATFERHGETPHGTWKRPRQLVTRRDTRSAFFAKTACLARAVHYPRRGRIRAPQWGHFQTPNTPHGSQILLSLTLLRGLTYDTVPMIVGPHTSAHRCRGAPGWAARLRIQRWVLRRGGAKRRKVGMGGRA